MIKSNSMTLVAIALSLAIAANQSVAEMKCGSDMDMGDHKAMKMVQADVTHKTVTVDIPDVVQIRPDGKKVKFVDEINDGRPVVLNFIFTTCTAICPISSSIFMQLQHKLGKNIDKVHLVSISIDPEQDTPRVLRDYSKKYHAGANWDFYTGTANNSIAIQEAFNVYRGDKMSHDPVTFVRTAPGKTWMRIDGFTTANALLQDYHKQLAANN
jgi:protein SCO1/2